VTSSDQRQNNGSFLTHALAFFWSNKISGMSGGRRCPPFEDGHRKNTGQHSASAHDFRVPAEATANWLQRTTYQIDNNAVAGNYLLMTSISNYVELLGRQFQRLCGRIFYLFGTRKSSSSNAESSTSYLFESKLEIELQ
jgi:hypothetical protein